MSGTILVKELNRHIDQPSPPPYYSDPAQVAWRRGFGARCWLKGQNPYTRTYMRHAWVAGWDAADTAIRAVGGG